jgi:hypothetical protein
LAFDKELVAKELFHWVYDKPAVLPVDVILDDVRSIVNGAHTADIGATVTVGRGLIIRKDVPVNVHPVTALVTDNVPEYGLDPDVADPGIVISKDPDGEVSGLDPDKVGSISENPFANELVFHIILY